MKNWRLFVLIYNFALPGLLLNVLGIFTLQLINNYNVSMNSVSWLEGFKDISIWVASFLFAAYIPKMGYKKSILIGTFLGIAACLLMSFYPSFLTARLYFVLVGVGFALIKISVYSTVGLIASNEKEHASFISILESFFMFGLLFGFWLFAFAIHQGDWLYAFWIQTALGVVGLGLLLSTPIDESKLQSEGKKSHLGFSGYSEMFLLLAQSAVWMFIVLVFCYLFIEQGVINWLPTFNNKQLHISAAASVELASLLSAAIAFGRLVFGVVMRFIHWSKVLMFCLVAGIAILCLGVYTAFHTPAPTQEITNWLNFPIAAYLLPLFGFFIAPIYPAFSSSILSKQPLSKQSAMTVWIVIFSALGATIGSRILGYLFADFGGLAAMGILIVPLVILIVLLIPYCWYLNNCSNSSK